MILDALHQLANHSESLSRMAARAVMGEVLSGQCTDAQIAALLVALRMKGETVEEIVGFAEAIRAAASPLPMERGADAIAVSGTGREALAEECENDALVDTSGTGGDASGTFNISTATALVTAGAGVRVAKHGNRSISSKCGSADVVEALGINIQLSPQRAAQCLREVGICFLYAPNLHPAMKQVQGLRRALVVHGLDGLDEITITGVTRVAEAREGSVRSYEVEPEEFGMKRGTLQELAGGDAHENADIIRAVLGGEKSARRDVVLLNSAAALVAAGKVNHIAEGISLA